MATDRGWRGLFSKIAEAVGIADDEPVVEPLPGTKRDYADEDIRLSLDEFLASEAGRFGTRLHLISLEEFRIAVGEHWRRLEPRAVMIAEATIQRHLGRGQHWGRKGSEMFALVFPRMPADQATAKVTAIAAEIGRRLLGTSRFTGAEPLARIATMAAEEAMTGGVLDVSILSRAVQETGISVPPSEAPADMDQPAARRAAREDEAAGLDELRWHMRPGQRAGGDGTPDLRRSMLPSRPAEPPPAEAPRRAAPPAAPSPAPAPPPPPPAEDEIDLGHCELVWRPAWIAEEQAVSAFQAIVQRTVSSTTPPMVGPRAYPPDGGEMGVAIDTRVARDAMEMLATLAREGNKVLLVLPMHVDSLQPRWLGAACAPLNAIPEAVRLVRLVIEVFGVGDALDADDLRRAVAAARPLCREVAVRTGALDARLKAAAGAGAAIAAFDLAPLTGGAEAAIRDFAAAAKAHRLRAWAQGARSRAVLSAAAEAGCGLLGGPALAADQPKPGPRLSLPRDRLLAVPK